MKKQLVLTGLAHETDFSSDGPEGRFYLVFNKGELRIRVTTEGAQQALEQLMSNGKQVSETTKGVEDELSPLSSGNNPLADYHGHDEYSEVKETSSFESDDDDGVPSV